MNKTELITFFRNPGELSTAQLEELEAIVEEHPYFLSARLLLAKASKEQNHPKTKNRIASAAIYSTDRVLLKKYLNDRLFFLSQPPLPEKSVEKSTQPTTPKIASDTDTKPITSDKEQAVEKPKMVKAVPDRTKDEPAQKPKHPSQTQPKKSEADKEKVKATPQVPQPSGGLDSILEELQRDMENLKASRAKFIQIQQKIEEEDAVDSALEKVSNTPTSAIKMDDKPVETAKVESDKTPPKQETEENESRTENKAIEEIDTEKLIKEAEASAEEARKAALDITRQLLEAAKKAKEEVVKEELQAETKAQESKPTKKESKEEKTPEVSSEEQPTKRPSTEPEIAQEEQKDETKEPEQQVEAKESAATSEKEDKSAGKVVVEDDTSEKSKEETTTNTSTDQKEPEPKEKVKPQEEKSEGVKEETDEERAERVVRERRFGGFQLRSTLTPNLEELDTSFLDLDDDQPKSKKEGKAESKKIEKEETETSTKDQVKEKGTKKKEEKGKEDPIKPKEEESKASETKSLKKESAKDEKDITVPKKEKPKEEKPKKKEPEVQVEPQKSTTQAKAKDTPNEKIKLPDLSKAKHVERRNPRRTKSIRDEVRAEGKPAKQEKSTPTANKKEEKKSPDEPATEEQKTIATEPGKEDKKETSEVKKDKSGKDPNEIIERFIKEQPTIKYKPKESPRPEDLAEKSSVWDPNLASEYLAEIYLHQGNKKRAIEIYEALSLKYPEKKSYFADLISKIE